MTMDEVIAENKALKQQVFLLKQEIGELKNMIFAAKRERFVTAQNPNQGLLFEEEQLTQEEAVVEKEQKQVAKASNKKKTKKSIKRNTFPATLQRRTTLIEPEGIDLEQSVKIGEDITEILAYTPGSYHVEQIVRPRRVEKGNEDAGVKQANIPPRLIPKGMVDESVVAHLIIEKILFHTPIHRFYLV